MQALEPIEALEHLHGLFAQTAVAVVEDVNHE
jgi:hypothetical protein